MAGEVGSTVTLSDLAFAWTCAVVMVIALIVGAVKGCEIANPQHITVEQK